MGQKDLAQNDYYNDKVRFADACNGILFQGKEIIKPEELEETDADIVYREEEGKLRKVIPDKVRKWKGTYIAVLSMENQSKVDYHMVFRAMKSEAAYYERRWKEREQEYKRLGLLHEKAQLCWSGKEERFVPVITIVIYYGTDEKWDGAKCLYDMLEIDKELEPFVNNYKLNLFDYHDCKDFSIFKTENRILFELLSCACDKKAMKRLLDKNRERYNKVDRNIMRTMFDIIGVRYREKEDTDKEGDGDMCKAIEEWAEEERTAGKIEGRIEGKLEGRLEGTTEALRNIMDSLKITAMEAMDILKIEKEERTEYLKLINNNLVKNG